jgi:hypothetical protein
MFMVGVVTIGYLMFDAQTALRASTETTSATLLAREGIEAIHSISDFDDLPAGTHGLVLQDGRWKLSGTSDVTGKFNRSIAVSDIDPETKEIISAVSWNTTAVRENTVSLNDRVTDWRATQGNAAYLEVTTETALLTASNTALTWVTLENIGATDIILAGMTVQWDGASTLNTINLAGTDIFSVATSSGVLSGMPIDTEDYLLATGSGLKVFDAILFDASVLGTDFVLTFTLSDGSRKHVLVSL